MAKISFNAVPSNNEGNNQSNVGFFALKNDGDEAVVRIMHNSVDDFDILTTHSVNIGGKFRSVNCLRDPMEPIDACPLCKNGTKIQSRIFIHMIQYVKDANGNIEAKPVTWERSANEYGKKLKALLDEYGPLSESVFKVRRSGRPGDMKTTYEILFGNPAMYNEQLYPKMPDAFDNYSVLGTVVMDKKFDEVATFVSTGSFPGATNNSNAGTNNSGYSAQEARQVIENTVEETPMARTAPWENPVNSGQAATTAPTRPTRYY